MPPVNPAPGKGYVRVRPTPLVGDVLFYELRDRDVASNQTPPAYGTAHPDTRQWPDHKLVFVDPADNTGYERWWYAADRANQDNYNYEFTRDDSRELIVRTRIVPREEATWDGTALGTAFDEVPAAVFDSATGHVLIERAVKQIDDERIRSIYVAEILVYEKVPAEPQTEEVDQGCYNYFIVTQRVPTANPGNPPAGPDGSVLVDSSLKPDPEHPEISIWTARYEILPSGVWNELRTVGDALTAVARQRVETANPGNPPSLPLGYEELETVLRATSESCLVSEWAVSGEQLPGPVFETEDEQDGFTITTKTQRVLTSTPGTAPAPPAGHDVIRSTLDATDNNLVSRWVVQSRDTVDRTEVTTKSASVDGVVTQVRTLQTTEESATSTTVSLGNEAQTRDTNGTIVLWSTTKADLQVITEDPVSTGIDFRPGVTLRSTSNVVTTPVERTDVASYQNTLRERNVDGTPIAWSEQVTTSAARPMVAGVEVDQRPMVTLNTTKRYSTSSAVGSPSGSSSVSYFDPTLTVFQVNETRATGKERTIGISKDARVGYTIETTESYSLNNTISTAIGSVDIAFDDSAVVVFKKGEARAVVQPISYVGRKSKNPLYTSTTNTRVGLSSAIGTDIGEATPVYVDRDTTIYRTDEVTNVATGPRTYETLVTASVPAVLQSLIISTVPLKNGTSKYRATPIIEEGYTGTFAARITEYWTPTAPSGGFEPIVFKPVPITVDLARLNFSIGATLHGARTITEVIGTEDPVFEFGVYSVTIPATEPSSIPTGYVPFARDVDQLEDGFRVREIYIKYR